MKSFLRWLNPFASIAPLFRSTESSLEALSESVLNDLIREGFEFAPRPSRDSDFTFISRVGCSVIDFAMHIGL
jgi:hypothetical protein